MSREWDGCASNGWHWLFRKSTEASCMAHYDRRDCWYVSDRKGRTYRMHEPKVAHLFEYIAPAAAPETDREVRTLLRLALDNIQGIADGCDIPSTAIRDRGYAILKSTEGE